MLLTQLWLTAINMAKRHIGVTMLSRKPMQIRLPKELKDWIDQEAQENGSTRNSEVVRSIRERMESKEKQKVER
ncbi:MAG: Arc family DNA-binding protein [Pseudomonadota bacterium]